MTADEYVIARNAATPHIAAWVFAKGQGRCDAHAGEPRDNAFVNPEFRAAYDAGYREVLAEDRLNNDTDWD